MLAPRKKGQILMQLFGIIGQCKRLSSDDFQHFSKIEHQQMYYKWDPEPRLPTAENYLFTFLLFILWKPGKIYKNAPYNFCDEAILVHIRFVCSSIFMKQVKKLHSFFFCFFVSCLCAIFTSMTWIPKKKKFSDASALSHHTTLSLLRSQFDTSCP